MRARVRTFRVSSVFPAIFSLLSLARARFDGRSLGVLIEWKAIIYTTLGGVIGIIFGLEYCQLTPPYAKM